MPIYKDSSKGLEVIRPIYNWYRGPSCVWMEFSFEERITISGMDFVCLISFWVDVVDWTLFLLIDSF